MEFVLFYLVAQTAATDSQGFGGAALVSSIVVECFLNK